jgi:hypothetical protein
MEIAATRSCQLQLEVGIHARFDPMGGDWTKRSFLFLQLLESSARLRNPGIQRMEDRVSCGFW